MFTDTTTVNDINEIICNYFSMSVVRRYDRVVESVFFYPNKKSRFVIEGSQRGVMEIGDLNLASPA